MSSHCSVPQGPRSSPCRRQSARLASRSTVRPSPRDPLTQRSTEVGINGNATNSVTNFDPVNVYNPPVLLIRATHGVPCQVQMHSRFWSTVGDAQQGVHMLARDLRERRRRPDLVGCSRTTPGSNP